MKKSSVPCCPDDSAPNELDAEPIIAACARYQGNQIAHRSREHERFVEAYFHFYGNIPKTAKSGLGCAVLMRSAR